MAKITITALAADHSAFRFHEMEKRGFVGVVLHCRAIIAIGKRAWAAKEEALAEARNLARRCGPSKMPASIRQRYAYDR